MPEIVVGSRADDGTLTSTHTLVVEDMYPAAAGGQEGVRERGYRMAYNVLTHLRAFCAAHGHANDTRGLIWRTEVCNGIVVKPPVLLEDTRKEGGAAAWWRRSTLCDSPRLRHEAQWFVDTYMYPVILSAYEQIFDGRVYNNEAETRPRRSDNRWPGQSSAAKEFVYGQVV